MCNDFTENSILDCLRNAREMMTNPPPQQPYTLIVHPLIAKELEYQMFINNCKVRLIRSIRSRKILKVKRSFRQRRYYE